LTVASFAAYLHTNITAVGLVDLVVSPGVPNVVKVIELLNEVGLSTKVAATVECVAVSAVSLDLLAETPSSPLTKAPFTLHWSDIYSAAYPAIFPLHGGRDDPWEGVRRYYG
jgi:hypothetical protein